MIKLVKELKVPALNMLCDRLILDEDERLAIPRLWNDALAEESADDKLEEFQPVAIRLDPSCADAATPSPVHKLFAQRIANQLQRNMFVALSFSVLLAMLGSLIGDRLICVAALTYAGGHLLNGFLTRIAVDNISQTFETTASK